MKEKKEKSVYNMPKFLLLSFLCLVLTLVTTTGLLVSLTSWRMLRYNELPNAIASVHLEDVTVDTDGDEKESLAQYILDNFVKDDRITVEQIENILQSGDFTKWAGWMVSQYSNYLSADDTSAFPQLNEEDIIVLIEENADLIYQETGLRFLEPDKEKLLDTLKKPMEEIDEHLDSSLNSGAGGALTKFFLSCQCWTVLGIALILLLVWEIVIHKRSNRRTGSALQAYSVAGAVPSLAFFLAGTCSALVLNIIDMPFLKDAVRAVKGTLIAVGGIGLLACIALFVAGMTANLVVAQLRTEALETNPQENNIPEDFRIENEPENKPETLPEMGRIPETVPSSPHDTKSEQKQPTPEPVRLVKDSDKKPVKETPVSAPPRVNLSKPTDKKAETETQKNIIRKFCRFCGKPLFLENASFCGECGKKQIKDNSSK